MVAAYRSDGGNEIDPRKTMFWLGHGGPFDQAQKFVKFFHFEQENRDNRTILILYMPSALYTWAFVLHFYQPKHTKPRNAVIGEVGLLKLYKSLTARITALVISIFVIIYLVAFYFANQFIVTARLELADQFLQQQVQVTRERTVSYFERDQKLIESGIEKGVYQIWMKDPSSFVGEDIAVSHLEVVCRLVECYGWFLVSHKTGEGISFSQTKGEYSENSLKEEDYAWYNPLINSGKTVYIDSSVDLVSGVRGVFLDYVLREDDEVLGIVGTYARLEDVLINLLSREDSRANNLLIDDHRRIRLDTNSELLSDPELPFVEFSGKDWGEMFSEDMRNDWVEQSAENKTFQTVVEINLNQQRYLAAVAYLDEVQWFAVSLYPLEEPNQLFDALPVMVLSIAFLILCIVATVAGLRRQVIKPVLKLNTVVDNITSGNYDARAGQVGADIIQNLASKIDQMGSTIAAQLNSLNQSNDALRHANKQAEKANESKSVFLSNMSHEIRTPLNGVLGTLQILERSNIDTDSKQMVTKAIFSARSLLTILNDILDFSKIEAHKLVLEKVPFSFLEVLESVKLDIIGEVERKEIALNVHIEENFHDGREGDYVRVKQILLNLTSNAVKFTEQGSVTITVTTEPDNAIKVEFKDTGIGISSEAQNRIFERFDQADSSTTRKYGGTGLGMPITVSLIRLMNGSIDVLSEKDKGTTITIFLPLPQAVFENDQHLHDSAAPKLDDKIILVAEDNDINQVIIKKMLEDTRARVVVVDNGKVAVEAFKRYAFDLVLMDIQMPEMDGVEAFKLIQQENDAVPVVALTANVMAEDVQKYNDLGFTDHMGKPIDLGRFYKMLSRILNAKVH